MEKYFNLKVKSTFDEKQIDEIIKEQLKQHQEFEDENQKQLTYDSYYERYKTNIKATDVLSHLFTQDLKQKEIIDIKYGQKYYILYPSFVSGNPIGATITHINMAGLIKTLEFPPELIEFCMMLTKYDNDIQIGKLDLSVNKDLKEIVNTLINRNIITANKKVKDNKIFYDNATSQYGDVLKVYGTPNHINILTIAKTTPHLYTAFHRVYDVANDMFYYCTSFTLTEALIEELAQYGFELKDKLEKQNQKEQKEFLEKSLDKRIAELQVELNSLIKEKENLDDTLNKIRDNNNDN